MAKARRHFLATISGLAALPAIGSALITEPRTGLAAVSSRDVRAQFPLLGDSMNGRPLVYLDSAATTQRPRVVLDTLDTFYLHENANPSMSLHALARHAAILYDEARATVARFLNARGADEIVFTRGTTEAINLVASSWGGANLGRGDEILITVSDHCSSLVPWQLAARRTGATLRIWDVSDDGHLRLRTLPFHLMHAEPGRVREG
jgi:cysteine desulfurase/selenocysteine lyase